MHRYTSLIWDSNKKTLLGKNGVSWLSIFLGTLVIVLCLGIFIHCVSEVKKSRQESNAQMRKMLIEKKLLSAQTGQARLRNVSDSPSISANSSSKNMPPSKTPLFINRSMIVLEESKTLADNIKEYEDLKEMKECNITKGKEFKTRDKRDILTVSIDQREFNDALNPEKTSVGGDVEPLRNQIPNTKGSLFLYPTSSMIGGSTHGFDPPKNKCKGHICKKCLENRISSFLRKLTKAKIDHFERPEPIHKTLSEVFDKTSVNSRIKINHTVIDTISLDKSKHEKKTEKAILVFSREAYSEVERSGTQSIAQFLNQLDRAKTRRFKRETSITANLSTENKLASQNRTAQNGPNPDDFVMNLTQERGPLIRNRRI